MRSKKREVVTAVKKGPDRRASKQELACSDGIPISSGCLAPTLQGGSKEASVMLANRGALINGQRIFLYGVFTNFLFRVMWRKKQVLI
jgi:hypothetical protein